MNVIKSRFVYHLMAIITVAIWGTTFVSTKILIQHGLSPSDIFFYRFTLAYLCMWCISYKKLCQQSKRWIVTFIGRIMWRNYLFHYWKYGSRYHISLQRVSDSMHITCSDHTAFLFVQKKRTFHPPSCLRIDHGFDRSGAGCFQRQFHSEN